MRKIKLLTIFSLAGLFFFACSSKKQTEETKMISATAVKMSGLHSDLLKINADSVRVMLVKISDDKWTLRAVLPIENTQKWEDIPGTDPSANSHFIPSMGNLSVEFLDANGSPIDFDLQPDWDVVKNVLSSNNSKTEDMLVKEAYDNLTPEKYDIAKEKYDKIAGIALRKMDLNTAYLSTGSSNSSAENVDDSDDNDLSDDDDLDVISDAVKAASDVVKAAGAASSKEVYKAAKKAEKEIKKWKKILTNGIGSHLNFLVLLQ